MGKHVNLPLPELLLRGLYYKVSVFQHSEVTPGRPLMRDAGPAVRMP